MPVELARHLEVERIAQRYGVLPTAVLREPAALVRHVRLMEHIEAEAERAGFEGAGGAD